MKRTALRAMVKNWVFWTNVLISSAAIAFFISAPIAPVAVPILLAVAVAGGVMALWTLYRYEVDRLEDQADAEVHVIARQSEKAVSA